MMLGVDVIVNKKEIKCENRIKRLMGDTYELASKYEKQDVAVAIRHTICGKVEWRKPCNLTKRSTCSHCRLASQTKSNSEFTEEILQLGYENLGEYKNAKEKVKVKHIACGTIWDVSPDNLLRRLKSCPVCAKNHVKTHEEFLLEAEMYMPTSFKIISPYRGERVKVDVLHTTCGTTFSVVPYSLKQAVNCPKCRSTSGELLVASILDELHIEYLVQHRFKDCLIKKPLPFDFFIPSLNLCIEYDGVQHYKPVNFGGFSDDELLIQFNEGKKRDLFKDAYCARKSIALIRIPYTLNYNDIKLLLKNKLNIR